MPQEPDIIKYFVSYSFQDRSGKTTFGWCDVNLYAPITGPADILEVTEMVSDVLPIGSAGVIVLYWRRFEEG